MVSQDLLVPVHRRPLVDVSSGVGQEIGEVAVNTGQLHFPSEPCVTPPIGDPDLAILARDRDAWRARADRRFDVEVLIQECIPDSATCDPSIVADAIREWFDSFETAFRHSGWRRKIDKRPALN